MISGCRIRGALMFAAILSASGLAAADTIVLKNGRRIAALSAFEEGDKVKYLTSAGELSLPKSIVDHIEKGGAMPMQAWPSHRQPWNRMERAAKSSKVRFTTGRSTGVSWRN